MTANMGTTALMGDLPWSEAARGGRRDWTADEGDISRVSLASQSDRPDDFEALKAAALEGVKPRRRGRTVVLPGPEGDVQVLHVDKMNRETQRALMERVMAAHGETDNLPLLQRVAARLERVGMQPPSVEVRYRGLSVLSRMTVGDRSLPTLKKTLKRQAEPVLRKLGRGPKLAQFPIIDNASGVIKPGVFTILLGPPGSGKTTFLQTLAGANRRDHSLKVRAQELSYNGRQLHEFFVERAAAYVSQNDLHYGELTVRETFQFAARCMSSGYKQDLNAELERRELEAGITPDPEVVAYMLGTAANRRHSSMMVEVILKLLGLDVCADTVVGSAMLRGISGGQKKRVTSGEMLVGPVRALFADEISTGLDSNTTYQIMKSLRNFTHVMKVATVVGLLQPQPEAFGLFDEVILLSNGKVCYHGPVEAVLPFFEGLGFRCPPRRGVADFLQEVTTPSDQQKYWDPQSGKPWRFLSAAMIEAEYKRSPQWAALQSVLDAPFDRATADPRALATKKYGQPRGELLRANFKRTVLLQARNKVFTIIRTAQVLLMAFVVATLFWREDKNTVEDGNLFFGVLFYSILYMLLGAISEMHLLVARLPVFWKQRHMRFYPGWCFAIPTFVTRIPYSFLEATIWTMLVYWIVGFSPNVRFLMFWFQLFLINIWSVGLFQLIAAVCRDDTIATSVGSLFLLLFINLTGFVLNKSNIPPWWIWGFWANPYAWVTRALAINEFTASHWMRPDPSNPGQMLGIEVLSFRGFPSEYWWVWASVGFLLVSLLGIVGLFLAAATYLGAPKQRHVLTPEAVQDFEMSRKELLTPQPSITEETAERGAVRWPSTAAEAGSVAAASTTTVPVSSVPAASTTAGNTSSVPTTASAPQWGAAAGPAPSAGAAAAADGNGAAGAPMTPRRAFMQRASERISQASLQAQTYRQRTVIPFTPCTLTFKNVEYSVPLPPDADKLRADVPSSGPHSGQLRLLKGIDGVFRPSVLTALMGASGADKRGTWAPLQLCACLTTLMDVIANRKTSGLITGDIRVSGHPMEPRTFARISGYVEQTDIHIAQTTVAEALHFSAHLRLPTTVDQPTRQAFVEEIMALVELNRLKHAYVGVPGVSGLSVEQRKRLTLAVELVANPSIVFMDEPTSGLDARAAGIVMDAVRATCDSGRVVVCTIHQPSIDIFEAFDELLLLKPGGATIYFGPMGDESDRLISYFEGIEGVPPCPERVNPANWKVRGGAEAVFRGSGTADARPNLHRASESQPVCRSRCPGLHTSLFCRSPRPLPRRMLEVSSPGSEDALGLDFADLYRSSQLAKEMGAVIDQHHEPKPGAAAAEMSELHIPGFKEQLATNLRRNFIIYNRAPEYNITRAAITILVGFAFGSMFWRQGDKRTTATGVLNIAGVLFSSTLFVGISNCLSIQHLVAAQRTVFYRERAAGLYRVMPFALAQLLVEVPYLIVQASAGGVGGWCVCVRAMVWFARDAASFFWFFWDFLLTLTYFTVLGIAAVNLTPSVPLSNVLCSFFFGFWNLLSGFLIPMPAMPGYWVWTAYINPVQWSIYGLSISQLGQFGSEPMTDLQGNTTTISQFLSDHFGWHTYMTGPIVAILGAFIMAFALVAVLSLKFINFQRR
ncbi:hypothetical protein ABPG77_001665 [Micractinium sp. CCAP 211/92]